MSAGIQWFMNLPKWWNIAYYPGSTGSSDTDTGEHDHDASPDDVTSMANMEAHVHGAGAQELLATTAVETHEHGVSPEEHEHGAEVSEGHAIVTVED